MKTITVENSYDLKVSGKPSLSIETLPTPKTVAVLPSQMAYSTPKSLVSEGDQVQIGSPLFKDPLYPDVAFLSPGSGIVSKITYGPDQSLDEIVITLDATETHVTTPAIPHSVMKTMSREDILKRIVESGTWSFLRTFPFNKMANPAEVPPAIYLTIDSDEPHLPQSQSFLKDKTDSLKYGIRVLQKLCDTVHIGASASNTSIRKHLHGQLTHTIKGGYPANHPAVFMYHNKKDATDHKAWHIHAQNLLLIAQALEFGRYPTERMVVVAGAHAKNKCHLKTRLGVPISALLDGYKPSENTRYIAGGVLTGRKTDVNSYLGQFETALHLLPENKDNELLEFMALGMAKPSFSKAFLSGLYPAQALKMTANMHGRESACISCGACPRACPVDLQPQFLLRELIANEIGNAVKQGLLDCVECGLCTYVCPSKIELGTLLSSAKSTLAKEAA